MTEPGNITPGTWKAIFVAKQPDGYERYDVVAEGERRELVAICWDTGEGGNPVIHDARANANLIAAAPELRDACEEALRVCVECWPKFHQPCPVFVIRRLQTALEKARGGNKRLEEAEPDGHETNKMLR